MRIFLLLFIMLLFGGKTVSYAAATDGVLDLRNFDFREKGFASLDGDWDFYWQCFVPPDSLGKYEKVKEVVHVPLGWAGYKLGSKPVRDFGFASYHLRILVSDTTVLYKLLIDRVHSAAVFWANGVRVGSLGNVGRTADAEIADVVHITDVFGHNIQPVNGVVDLVVWVSNFQVAGSSAGISRHIRIAPAGVALQEYARDKVLYSGMVGMMLLFAVYHLILFLYRRKEYSILSFGLLSLFFAFRTALTTSLVTELFFGHYALSWKLSYLPVAVYPVLMCWFFYFLFPTVFFARIRNLITVVGMGFSFVVLFSDVYVLSSTDSYIGGFLMVSQIYFFVGVFVAFIRKRLGSTWALFGVSALMIATLNDFLYSFHVIDTGYWVQYGLLVYILAQSANLAKRFSLAYNRVESLSVELDFKNRNLELIVNQRTEELELRHKELVEAMEELNQTNEELNSQKDEIEFQKNEVLQRSEELRVINDQLIDQRNEMMLQRDQLDFQHRQISASIRYAKTIQEAIIPTDVELGTMLPSFFTVFRPKDVVSGDFYWVGRIDNVEKGLHKHFVALVDCTGHGVPGGFMSMICSSLLNQEILEKQSVEPARILSDLDLRLRKALRQSAGTNSDGMDMALCMYEYLPDGSVALVFAGAKRPLFYYSRDIGEVRILKVGHRMLGGTGHRLSNEFEQVSLILKQGDHIYLSSDGFIDQNGPKHKRLGTPKFLALLNEIKDLPLDEQGAQLRAELDKRQQGFEQRDDISLIGFSL